jgi:hypothetical protein
VAAWHATLEANLDGFFGSEEKGIKARDRRRFRMAPFAVSIPPGPPLGRVILLPMILDAGAAPTDAGSAIMACARTELFRTLGEVFRYGRPNES